MKTRQLSAREAKDLDAELAYWYSYAKKGIEILPEDKINSVEDFIKAYNALCDVTQRLLAYIHTPAGSRYLNSDFLERFQSGVDMRFDQLTRKEAATVPHLFSTRAFREAYEPRSWEWNNKLQGKLTEAVSLALAHETEAEYNYWAIYAKEHVELQPEDKIKSVDDFVTAFTTLHNMTHGFLKYIGTPAGSRYFNSNFITCFQSGVDLRFHQLTRTEAAKMPYLYKTWAYRDECEPRIGEWDKLQGQLTEAASLALAAEKNLPPSPSTIAPAVAQEPQAVPMQITLFGNRTASAPPSIPLASMKVT